MRHATVLDGHVRYLELPEGERLERLRAEVLQAKLADHSGSLRLRLLQSPSDWSVRDSKGRTLDSVALEWNDQGRAGGAAVIVAGRATVHTVDDFQPVRAAVADLAASQHEALGDAPFRPTGVMAALLDRLGVPHQQWCCEASPAAARLPLHDAGLLELEQPVKGLRQEDAGALEIARRRCGACHSGNTRVPPGFLRGGAIRAVEALRRCAPRIARRLSLWHTPNMAREQSPMPPASLLVSQGLSEEQWLASSDFLTLSRWARGKSRSGHDGDAASCLPLAASASQ